MCSKLKGGGQNTSLVVACSWVLANQHDLMPQPPHSTSKRQALAFDFSIQICYKFLKSKCGGESDLGLCLTLRFAKKMRVRSTDFRRILRSNTFKNRKSDLAAKHVLKSKVGTEQRYFLKIMHRPRFDSPLHFDIGSILLQIRFKRLIWAGSTRFFVKIEFLLSLDRLSPNNWKKKGFWEIFRINNPNKWKKRCFWGKFRISSGVLRVARGGYAAVCRAPRKNKILALGDCFLQPCSTACRRFAASRSRLNWFWQFVSFPQQHIRRNAL